MEKHAEAQMKGRLVVNGVQNPMWQDVKLGCNEKKKTRFGVIEREMAKVAEERAVVINAASRLDAVRKKQQQEEEGASHGGPSHPSNNERRSFFSLSCPCSSWGGKVAQVNRGGWARLELRGTKKDRELGKEKKTYKCAFTSAASA